jgi:hypothetical protein
MFYRTEETKRGSGLPMPRTLASIVREIQGNAVLGVREFVFFDEEIFEEDHDLFVKLLTRIATLNLKVRFILAGNMTPQFISKDVALKLGEANVKQIVLRSRLIHRQTGYEYGSSLTQYEQCTRLLVSYGKYRARDGSIAAAHPIGLQNEDLGVVTERMIYLANIVGSVIPVPFQYGSTLHLLPTAIPALTHFRPFSPDELNGKLFLLARLSGKSFEDYSEVLRLATLLNHKLHSKTFAFLGDTLSAKLLRNTLKSKTWQPLEEAVNVGTHVQLPAITLNSVADFGG